MCVICVPVNKPHDVYVCLCVSVCVSVCVCDHYNTSLG